MAELLYRLGRIAARRRMTVIATWIAILAIAVGAFAAFGKTPSSAISIPGTPTEVVTSHLAASMPGVAGANGTVVFSTRDGSPFTDAQKADVAEAIARAAAVPGVTRVVDPFAAQAQGEAQAQQVSDGRAQIDAGRAQLAAGQQQLDAAKAQLNAQQQQLDAGKAQLAAKQQQLDAGLAAVAAQSKQLEDGATLMGLASKIRLVSADGSTAVVPVLFSGTGLSVPQEVKTAVQAAFLTPTIAGVDVNFSSEIAQGIPNLVGLGEMAGLVVAAIVLLLVLRTVVGGKTVFEAK